MANPKRNQKVMGEEEKEILRESAKVRNEQRYNDEKALKQAEVTLFEKERDNLPALIENRLHALAEALETVSLNKDNVKGLTAPAIYKLLSMQSLPNPKRSYNAEQILIAKEAYMNAVEMVNEKVFHVPSIAGFCNFIGVSTNTYKNYMQSPKDDLRDAIMQVDDYIRDIAMSSAKTRVTDSMTTIFSMKAEHGMTEANAPQVIEVRNSVDVSDIRKRISELNGTVIDADFKEKGKE